MGGYFSSEPDISSTQVGSKRKRSNPTAKQRKKRRTTDPRENNVTPTNDPPPNEQQIPPVVSDNIIESESVDLPVVVEESTIEIAQETIQVEKESNEGTAVEESNEGTAETEEPQQTVFFPNLIFTEEFPPYPLYTECYTSSQNERSNSKEDGPYYVPQNFLKGVKWSPDGTCLLTNSEDKTIRLYETPNDLLMWKQPETVQSIQPVISIPHAEVVYDFCWYPLMQSSNPTSSTFLTCSKDTPVHMWDAFTGKIRCSYTPHDHLDELNSAISLSFNTTGEKIYTGFNKCIRIFDTARPGKECITISTVKKDRKAKSGQFGLISCFASCPDTAYSDLFAAGSFSSTIGLYSDKDTQLINILSGHKSGITSLKFSPSGGFLFSGARKENVILCWDMRNFSSPIAKFERESTTNQRISFDIHPSGSHLITGSQGGNIIFYDLQTFEKVLEIPAHVDCCNGVDFHPYFPYFASSSGERTFFEVDETDSVPRNAMVEKANSLSLWAVPFSTENKKIQ